MLLEHLGMFNMTYFAMGREKQPNQAENQISQFLVYDNLVYR